MDCSVYSRHAVRKIVEVSVWIGEFVMVDSPVNYGHAEILVDGRLSETLNEQFNLVVCGDGVVGFL